MIRLQDYTPEVYYKQSRDFQFIGRLFDIVLNSIKTNTELIYNVPVNDNSDLSLMDLLAMSLGFKSKHNYNVKQLIALCKVFPVVLRNKGNIKAIELAGKALLNAEGLPSEIECVVENNNLKIFISRQLTDTNLFRDLLTYILPAGISCDIVRSVVTDTPALISEFNTNSNVLYRKALNKKVTYIPTAEELQEKDSNDLLNNNYLYINQTINTVEQADEPLKETSNEQQKAE